MENLPGTVSRSQSKTVYWNITGGKFARNANEGEAGAMKRENKFKKIVWEIFSDGLTGNIIDVNVYENSFDGIKTKQLVIKLIPVEGWVYVINVSKESRYFNSFIEKLPNININEKVELYPYNFEDKETGKKQTGITVIQNGIKITTAYKEKVGEKYVVKKGMPPFPEDWASLEDFEKKHYFAKVGSFLEKEVYAWRDQNIQTEPSYKEKMFDEPLKEKGTVMPVKQFPSNTEDDLPF